jgi:hypothetical protein
VTLTKARLSSRKVSVTLKPDSSQIGDMYTNFSNNHQYRLTQKKIVPVGVEFFLTRADRQTERRTALEHETR